MKVLSLEYFALYGITWPFTQISLGKSCIAHVKGGRIQNLNVDRVWLINDEMFLDNEVQTFVSS